MRTNLVQDLKISSFPTALPGAKPALLIAGIRTFACGEAVLPEVHYYADTGTERKLQPIIDSLEYALLIDHRQAGKSTAVQALARNNADTLLLYLLPLPVGASTPKSSSRSDNSSTLQQC